MIFQIILSGLEYLQGGLTLAFVLISLILGIIIISKYFNYKNRQLLLVGLTWIFLVSPYWPDAISFLMIKPMVKKSDAKNNAAYAIVVTWPDGCLDDVDSWLEDPRGKLVWFRSKETEVAHLDRDDLGMANDILQLADGSVIRNERNQEIITIRGFIAGEWTLNIHMYKKRVQDPTPVTVTIDRINPSYKTLLMKKIILETAWQEETVSRFDMLPSGDILSWSDLPKKLVDYDELYGVGLGEDR